jgi:hypothetical protein
MSRVDCVMVLLAVIAHSYVLKLWCGGVVVCCCGGVVVGYKILAGQIHQ